MNAQVKAIRELSHIDNATLVRAMERVHGTDEAKARTMKEINDFRTIEATMNKWFNK